uniref:Vesicle-fusing ATPase n=1 Tax=Globodera pallida TaxID=36090 RepID=A0A183BKN5_GLOPA
MLKEEDEFVALRAVQIDAEILDNTLISMLQAQIDQILDNANCLQQYKQHLRECITSLYFLPYFFTGQSPGQRMLHIRTKFRRIETACRLVDFIYFWLFLARGGPLRPTEWLFGVRTVYVQKPTIGSLNFAGLNRELLGNSFVQLSFLFMPLFNVLKRHLLKISRSETFNNAPTNSKHIQLRATVRCADYIKVVTGPAHHYYFSLANHAGITNGEIGFSLPQRKWTNVTLGQEVQIQPFSFTPGQRIITVISLIIDFQKKPSNPSEPLDTDAMAREFLMQFANMVFSVTQELVLEYVQLKQGAGGAGDSSVVKSAMNTTYTLKLVVKRMEGANLNSAPEEISLGPLSPNAVVIFDRPENSQMNLIGRSKGKSSHRALINPDWDFQQMGIGGLDKEFSSIFRRAFASRVFPPEFIEQLAMKHVRGILLYGPPGTGKTLIARQIGKMLNAREPKIVNGPEILNKFVLQLKNLEKMVSIVKIRL